MIRVSAKAAIIIATLLLPASARSAEPSWLMSPGQLVTMTTMDLRRPISNRLTTISPMMGEPTSGMDGAEFSRNRLAIWGGVVAGAGYLAYEQSQASWGLSNGKFHFKDELNDGLALSDETSHLFAAYHLTRALKTGYSWTGMSSTAARRMAAAHAWVWTFLVEYPIDALNPTQGFGASDLAFNTVGVLAAYQHTRPGPSPWWDVKISVKKSYFAGESRFIAHSNKQYDDYVYWLTVRPTRNRYIPLWVGAGYSTTHREWPRIDKELHLAVGTTVEELARVLSEDAARFLRPLNFFYLNIGSKFVWR